jgi:hypothetical protein
MTPVGDMRPVRGAGATGFMGYRVAFRWLHPVADRTRG